MHKIGWLIPAILLAIGCQKSPGAFDERPDESRDQSPAEGRDEGREMGRDEGQPGADREGEDYPDQGSPYTGDEARPEGTQPEGTQPGMEGTEPGTQGGELGQTGQIGQEGVPQAIQALQQNVTEMRNTQELEHTALVRSIRDLGNAFAALPEGDTPAVKDAVSRINSYADRIEAAGATSDMYGRWAKRALDEAVGAIDGYQKERQLTEVEQRIEPLRSQVNAIVDDETFLKNAAAYADAYQQIADTLAIASTSSAPDRGTR